MALPYNNGTVIGYSEYRLGAHGGTKQNMRIELGEMPRTIVCFFFSGDLANKVVGARIAKQKTGRDFKWNILWDIICFFDG